MYNTGSKHYIFAGEDMVEAVVLHNNGEVAVLGIATSMDITYDEFLMPADDKIGRASCRERVFRPV